MRYLIDDVIKAVHNGVDEHVFVPQKGCSGPIALTVREILGGVAYSGVAYSRGYPNDGTEPLTHHFNLLPSGTLLDVSRQSYPLSWSLTSVHEYNRVDEETNFRFRLLLARVKEYLNG